MKQWRILICSVLLFFLSTTFLYGQQVDIRILYINDFHGFAESYKPLGSDVGIIGFQKVVAAIFRMR